MSNGALALVLHAHLPYVRSVQPGSLEEDWFFQALIECYLPLLETFWSRRSSRSAASQPEAHHRSLSPTLLSLLSDQDLQAALPQLD